MLITPPEPKKVQIINQHPEVHKQGPMCKNKQHCAKQHCFWRPLAKGLGLVTSFGQVLRPGQTRAWAWAYAQAQAWVKALTQAQANECPGPGLGLDPSSPAWPMAKALA